MTRHAAEAKRLREAEQERRRESAANTADAIWSAATIASDDHPYIVAKGITAMGLRVRTPLLEGCAARSHLGGQCAHGCDCTRA